MTFTSTLYASTSTVYHDNLASPDRPLTSQYELPRDSSHADWSSMHLIVLEPPSPGQGMSILKRSPVRHAREDSIDQFPSFLRSFYSNVTQSDPLAVPLCSPLEPARAPW